MKFLSSEYHSFREVLTSAEKSESAYDFVKSKGWLTVRHQGRIFSFHRTDESYMDEQFRMVKAMSYSLRLGDGKVVKGVEWEEVVRRFEEWVRG